MDETAYDFEKEQSVIMVIGVTVWGRPPSVGKLAGKLKDEGRKVLLPQRILSVPQRETSWQSGHPGRMFP